MVSGLLLLTPVMEKQVQLKDSETVERQQPQEMY